MKNKYYIDKISNKIYKDTEVISEKIITLNVSSTQKIKEILFNEKYLIIFICEYKTEKSDYLQEVSVDKVQLQWDTEYSKNISFEKEEGDLLENYPRNFFYFVDFWQGLSNELIIIFYRNH